MTNLKMIRICVQVNFQKWLVNPRIYTLAVLMIAFLAYHSFGPSQFAADKGIALTPWVFPHLITPPVLQVFACFIILLFSDAPFADRHMPFLIIRSGRRNWIIGQLLYIVTAAFVFTIFILFISMLVLIPNVQLSTDWGIILKTLAVSTEIIPSVTIFPDERIITMFSVLEAMLISFGLFWLVSIFIGVLIFFFNIVIGKMSGLVASGVFIFISFFSIIHGRLILGDWISYLSPISWMSISFFDWNNSMGFSSPSPMYAVICLVGSILLMSIVSTIVFCKKDLDIQEWGY